jgi:hypothetical protein
LIEFADPVPDLSFLGLLVRVGLRSRGKLGARVVEVLAGEEFGHPVVEAGDDSVLTNVVGSRVVTVVGGEQELGATEERVRRLREDLRTWENELEIREWRVETVGMLSTQPARVRAKTGRNERCRCGSGLKYKHCHGLPADGNEPSQPLNRAASWTSTRSPAKPYADRSEDPPDTGTIDSSFPETDPLQGG